jgi:hypothetical protein
VCELEPNPRLTAGEHISRHLFDSKGKEAERQEGKQGIMPIYGTRGKDGTGHYSTAGHAGQQDGGKKTSRKRTRETCENEAETLEALVGFGSVASTI